MSWIFSRIIRKTSNKSDRYGNPGDPVGRPPYIPKCSICGKPITESDERTVDDDGNVVHWSCYMDYVVARGYL